MWWHILGVEAEADKATVKKTYAQTIKTIDQDNDIDEFSKIHQAFRLAMKSFKKVEEKENEYIYLEESDEYIKYLDKIYSDETKRLKPNIWENIFACMSFKEEDSFSNKYIDYFNEHYLLIDEIWELVDKQYPLSNQKTFKWHDLSNGNFTLNLEELRLVHEDKQCRYVEQKISIYYNIIHKNYSQALDEMKLFINEFDGGKIAKWYMTLAITLDERKEVEKAFDLLLHNPETQDDGYYQMAGYLTRMGQYSQSDLMLLKIKNQNIFVQQLMKENQQGLSDKEIDGVNVLPWTEITYCHKKKIKLLSSGNYAKALKLDTAGLWALIGKGGKA